jgi:outer membrane receptor protein involved in Fe transport
LHLRPNERLNLLGSYTYDATQILDAPLAFDPLLVAGRPLLRRPLHSGTAGVQYTTARWGGLVSAVFVGPRPDSDFLGLASPPIDHSAGYGRVDLGGWYALKPRVTAYLNIENALNRHYEEAAGYPALKANFRAGLRFRLGGE